MSTSASQKIFAIQATRKYLHKTKQNAMTSAWCEAIIEYSETNTSQ